MDTYEYEYNMYDTDTKDRLRQYIIHIILWKTSYSYRRSKAAKQQSIAGLAATRWRLGDQIAGVDQLDMIGENI